MLGDAAIPAAHRDLLIAHRGAFYLGQVAADGHELSAAKREDTHFYNYTTPITEHPWRVMMDRNPSLWDRHDEPFRAFLAGYIAHLGVDEHWLTAMLAPFFAERPDWADRYERFLMLHIILIHMDERDHAAVTSAHLFPAGDTAHQLGAAAPANWLPFMTDHGLREWGAVVYRQIKPDGRSETLDILAPRVKKTPADLRYILDTPNEINRRLWAFVPREYWMQTEREMYAFARDQMIAYLDGAR